MQVILLQDVKKLGKKGDVVRVADGYGRNFLFPKKLALLASQGAVSAIHKQQENKQHTKEHQKEQELSWEKSVREMKIRFERPSSGNVLFGAISPQDILERLRAQGVVVRAKDIHMAKSIKSLGEHEVRVCFPMTKRCVSLQVHINSQK